MIPHTKFFWGEKNQKIGLPNIVLTLLVKYNKNILVIQNYHIWSRTASTNTNITQNYHIAAIFIDSCVIQSFLAYTAAWCFSVFMQYLTIETYTIS